MVTVTKEGYIKELVDIREKLGDFIDLIKSGKTTYYKDIALKLRMLYMFKSGTAPLLKTIAELFGLKISVYICLNTHEKIEKGLMAASLGEGLVFEQINSVVRWFESGDEFVDLLEAISKKEVLIDDQPFSYKQIIEYAADKMGGAYLDKTHDPTHLGLHSDQILLGGLPIAQRAIFDTARASIQLISHIEDFVRNGNKSSFVCPNNG